MAQLNGFNANEVEPRNTFDPIPAGKYLAIIQDSEMKPTKSGNGSYLELVFQVIEDEFKGRLLWSRLNLDNPNELTVKIAQGELSAICRAVGVMQPKDSCELHNLPLLNAINEFLKFSLARLHRIRLFRLHTGCTGYPHPFPVSFLTQRHLHCPARVFWSFRLSGQSALQPPHP